MREPREIVEAAARALGRELTDPSDLGGSSRSSVLRCRTPDGATVVVKAYAQNEAGAVSYAREASSLEFCGRGATLLAEDAMSMLVVMTDLGSAPSLADALLGDDANLARETLIQWAAHYADLAAESVGRRAAWDVAIARRDPQGRAPRDATWIAECVAKIPGLLDLPGLSGLPGLGEVAARPALRADLDTVAVLSSPGAAFEVFSPGDICPDNNLVTAAGLRMLDFESAGFHSVFHDAAYTRMPFSSCWCVYRLPDPVRERVEVAYRERVAEAMPALTDDAFWGRSLRAACAIWTLHGMTYLLDRALEGDRPLHTRTATAPTIRQLLRYRWERLAEELEGAGELSALAGLMRALLKATERWGVAPIATYPAFAGAR